MKQGRSCCAVQLVLPLFPQLIAPTSRVLVSVPDQPVPQSFLISFFGADPFAANSDGNVVFLEHHIQEPLLDARGYDPLNANGRPYRDFQGPTAFRDLLGRMDQNGNGTVSTAEVNATTVRVMGWSLGAVEAVKFTTQATDTNGIAGEVLWNSGKRLETPVRFHTVVCLDPVTDGPSVALIRVSTKTIQSNVTRFRNYYQRRGGTSILSLWIQGTVGQFGFNPQHGVSFSSQIAGFDLRGRRIAIGALIDEQQVQVDTSAVYFNQERIQVTEYEDPGSEYFGTWDGVMLGRNTNHSTLVWYMRPEVLQALS